MQATVIFLFLIGTSLGAPSPRVIGGDIITTNTYPYLVSIQTTLFVTQHECSGAILSPTWIITAAHCVDITLLASRVVAGTYNLTEADVDNAPGVQIRNLDLYSVIRHTEFNDILYDIALLKLTEPFVFDDYVQPLPISKVPCVATDETTLFAGWGGQTGVSTLLEAAKMTLIPYDECYKIIYSVYGTNIPIREDIHICATSIASPCILDGGGPLIQDNRLIGLLSWLPETCLGTKIPAIFTNTGYFKNFIKKYVDDLPA